VLPPDSTTSEAVEARERAIFDALGALAEDERPRVVALAAEVRGELEARGYAGSSA
jgi:hypothetical protein